MPVWRRSAPHLPLIQIPVAATFGILAIVAARHRLRAGRSLGQDGFASATIAMVVSYDTWNRDTGSFCPTARLTACSPDRGGRSASASRRLLRRGLVFACPTRAGDRAPVVSLAGAAVSVIAGFWVIPSSRGRHRPGDRRVQSADRCLEPAARHLGYADRDPLCRWGSTATTPSTWWGAGLPQYLAANTER